MKNGRTLIFVLFLVFANFIARAVNSNNIELKTTYESTDGNCNYKHFIFNCSESAHYYCQFWLHASKKPNGYTEFELYLNGERIDKISPKKSGWQAICLDNIKSVQMKRGLNTLTFSTRNPEIPEIDLCEFSSTDSDIINSKAFDDYTIKANNNQYVNDVDNGMYNNVTLSTHENFSISQDVPLRYSFYKRYSFKEGQKIRLNTISKIPHSLDIFYLGQPYYTKDISINTLSSLENIGFEHIKPIYKKASSDEMQGLSWKRNSIIKLDTTPIEYFTDMRIKIPKTGIYMIKSRSANRNMLGSIEFYLNNEYECSSPIYYSYIDCEFPDSTNCGIIAKSDKSNTDPMLFVEGNLGGRIVGFADDTYNTDIKSQYNLQETDAFLAQSYKFKTSRIHVCNYSSLDPERTCTLKGFILDESSEFKSPQNDINQDIEERIVLSGKNIIRRQAITMCEPIEINPTNGIKGLTVYNIKGIILSDIPLNESTREILCKHIGINSKGMYLLVFHTTNGDISKKIIIK